MHGRVSMRVRCHSLTISGVLFAVIGVEVPEYRVPGLGRRFFSGDIHEGPVHEPVACRLIVVFVVEPDSVTAVP